MRLNTVILKEMARKNLKIWNFVTSVYRIDRVQTEFVVFAKPT